MPLVDASTLELRTPRGGRRLKGRQWLVLVSPVALIAVTYPVFHIAADVFGEALGGRLAWFVGMTFYWVVWGWVFP